MSNFVTRTDTAKLEDQLIGALIGLARATDGIPVPNSTYQTIFAALLTTEINGSSDDAITAMIENIHEEKHKLVPDCSVCAAPCGRTADCDMKEVWEAKEEVRSLKYLIISALREMAKYAYRAGLNGISNAEINTFFCEALFLIGYEEEVENLLQFTPRLGEFNLKCMELNK